MTSLVASSGSGFVDAGALWSFESSSTIRSDVLESTLLAQLAADKQHSRFMDSEDWYVFYLNTLGSLTWRIPKSQNQQYSPPGDTFTLEEAVLELLRKSVGDGQARLVQSCIQTFSELPPESQRVEIYEEYSRSASIINLQVGVMNPSSKLSAVGIVLRTQRTIDKLFTEEIAVSEVIGSIQSFLYQGTLDRKSYAPLREEVIKKLGPRRRELILELDLSPSSSWDR